MYHTYVLPSILHYYFLSKVCFNLPSLVLFLCTSLYSLYSENFIFQIHLFTFKFVSFIFMPYKILLPATPFWKLKQLVLVLSLSKRFWQFGFCFRSAVYWLKHVLFNLPCLGIVVNLYFWCLVCLTCRWAVDYSDLIPHLHKDLPIVKIAANLQPGALLICEIFHRHSATGFWNSFGGNPISATVARVLQPTKAYIATKLV